jgi:chemotaxis protein MotB
MNDAYFAPGSAVLTKDLQQTLVKVGKLVRQVNNYVRIEGHTDNNPIPISGVREGYETNWELSGARAINVLRFLAETENVKKERLSAVAFGATRPIYPNDTPEKRSYNRRVDIVLLHKQLKQRKKESNLPDHPLPDEEWRR